MIKEKVIVMNRWKKQLVPILSVLCILSVTVMIIVLCIAPKPEIGEFVPPMFDREAIKGIPEPPKELGWSELQQSGMTYRVGICGSPMMRGDAVEVYFSNAEENSVWLKLRVLDEKDRILGESGLIKPGEYVKSIRLETEIKDGKNVKLKVMAYEPETYYSAGSITLNTKIKVGG